MASADPDGLTIELSGADGIASLGPAAYGSWEQVLRSHAQRSGDARWHSELLVARRDGRVVGLANLHQARHDALPDANLRAELDRCAPGLLDQVSAHRLLFIGGHFALRGGLAILRTDAMTTEATLVAITRRAIAEAADRDALPLALYVPHDQVPGMLMGWEPSPATTVTHLVSVLHLQGARTMDEFLALARKEVRATWRRDQRLAEKAGISVTMTDLDDQLVAESAQLIATVKNRHGITDTARLTAFRLDGWRKSYRGRITAWTCRDDDGVLVGVAMAELGPAGLTMTEIGLAEDCANRSVLYHELAFHAPLRLALASGLSTVDLGADHSLPKYVRGAAQTLQWTLVGSPHLSGDHAVPGP